MITVALATGLRFSPTLLTNASAQKETTITPTHDKKAEFVSGVTYAFSQSGATTWMDSAELKELLKGTTAFSIRSDFGTRRVC